MSWFGRPSSRASSSSKRPKFSTTHSRHSAPSVFSTGGSSHRGGGRSSPSVFSSSSSRRARPRSGFIQNVIKSIKRIFREIYEYARKHPIKVLLLVVIPLITSGVLQRLLGKIGVRVPRSLAGSFGGVGGRGGEGMMGHIQSLMNVAKMVM